MPRAKRCFLSGYAWHITHRRHKREFLLKFAKDRTSWIVWLFEVKKRYRLQVLNYMITSNHVHLLVFDTSRRQIIPRSMQLIAGRTAQEFNQRKKRKGAFWEDRYHATAVETNDHLLSCLTYIDLNMVRAGVAAHPSEWAWSGYAEIQEPRERYSIVDHGALMELLGMHAIESLRQSHDAWIERALAREGLARDSRWAEGIAVGSDEFIEVIKRKLGIRAKGRRVFRMDDALALQEPQALLKL